VCSHVLKTTDENHLVEEMYKIEFCYNCEEEDLVIESSNVEVRYKIIKRPDDPEKIQSLCEDILGHKTCSSQDIIDNIINDTNYSINNLFYKPTVEQYKKLDELYCGLSCSHNNKTNQGKSLEELVKYLLNLVKPFEANGVWTEINQIDCIVRNKFRAVNTVLNELGNVFYCECKHEKKTPGNSYFLKLNSILQLSQNGTRQRRFGIVFSIKKPANTAEKISKKTFVHNNILMISFNLDELKRIIYEKVNFLDEIERKTNEIIHSITSDLRELELY